MTASSITTSTNDERAVLGCAVRDDKCLSLIHILRSQSVRLEFIATNGIFSMQLYIPRRFDIGIYAISIPILAIIVAASDVPY